MASRCYGCMRLKENTPVCEHCGYDEQACSKSHQLPPGTEVGNQYILGRVLGQGGFGITYIGWDKILGQRVAVKEYYPSGYAGRDTRVTYEVTNFDNQNQNAFEANKKRFLREAESLAKLWSIPQIVRVLRHFEENGTAYIAMEYAEGRDLRDYMKSLGRPMTMDEVVDILGPVVQALSHVHAADLVHRDISPDNIMVLPDGSGKLLDFGAARFVENADAEKDRNTSTQAILKHGFAPPEQYRSRGALGPWTDIYAMCATLYFCFAGRIPPESMSRMMGEAELELDKLPGLTREQRIALEKGMALMPKQRIKSAEELHAAFFGPVLARREEEKRRQELEKQRQQERLAAEKRKKEEAEELERKRQEAEEQRKEALLAKQEAERRKKEEKQARSREKKNTSTGEKRKGGSKLPQILGAVAAVVLTAALGMNLLSDRGASGTVSQEASPAMNVPKVTESGITGETAVPAAEETTVPVTTEAVIPLEIQRNLNLNGVETGSSHDIGILSGHSAEELQWTSLDPSVATVSGNGTVTVTGYGMTEITASHQGQSMSCRVIVNPVPNVDCTVGLEDGKLCITGFNGTLPENVILPAEVDGKVIQGIASYVFRQSHHVTSVYIPYGIESIGWDSFERCSKLKEIHIPESVTDIGPGAFRFTPWFTGYPDDYIIVGDGILIGYKGLEKDITIPDNVKTIGDAFARDSAVKSVMIPDTVTRLEAHAFYRCPSLVRVTIPGSIYKIGDGAFEDCTSLTGVTIAEGVAVIGNRAFYRCSSLAEINLPSSVCSLQTACFSLCKSLTGITVPEEVMYIDSYAFQGCGRLSQVILPEGLRQIGYMAFEGCSGLRELIIPESVDVISEGAFTGCSGIRSLTVNKHCNVYSSALPPGCKVNYYES